MKAIYAIGVFAMLSACRHPVRNSVRIPNPLPGVESPASVQREPPQPIACEGLPPAKPISADPEAPPIRDHAKVVAEANNKLLDIFFEYDRAGLSSDALSAVRTDAQLLAPLFAEFPQLKLRIEGHCDERGSAEYNLALGDRRAAATAEALRNLGLQTASIETLSYGKERPQCNQPNESCWSKNRRAHLTLALPPNGPTLP